MPKYTPTPDDEPMTECAYCGLPVLGHDSDFCDNTCRQLYQETMDDFYRIMTKEEE